MVNAEGAAPSDNAARPTPPERVFHETCVGARVMRCLRPLFMGVARARFKCCL
jgi:hypothetical protein